MTPRTPADLDPLLGDYFHAQRPTPWPPVHPGDRGGSHVVSRGGGGGDAAVRPTRFSSATRSRLTLALSAGLVLAGGLALTPTRRSAPAHSDGGTPPTSLMNGAQSNGKKTIHDLDNPKKP